MTLAFSNTACLSPKLSVCQWVYESSAYIKEIIILLFLAFPHIAYIIMCFTLLLKLGFRLTRDSPTQQADILEFFEVK